MSTPISQSTIQEWMDHAIEVSNNRQASLTQNPVTGTYVIEKEEYAYEITLYDGWGSVQGIKALSGIGTTINSIEELEEALLRIDAKRAEDLAR